MINQFWKDKLVFYMEDGSIVRKGTVGYYDPGFFDSSTGYGEPPSDELIATLSDIEVIFEYLDQQFPTGWIIKDRKVLSYE